ncbi:D-alanyl-D-alanine carboxypeptidase family protein [Levilactobacillus bambusae]|uniref:serine-type D-Ala-D-Ala carboxypeptidase n=1 Tax=Levilactobacillus bambusae TaxID=2024736 RepID=A0A2V1MXK7_9LACO|nr:D-alanyl-D-alanine carboxypeptidase family protein [Levilactobacillus bambusae]PWF99738.1 D-alanyl-D-alanine carboxypeptidase [Levilactobacillus bambusae]
MKFLHRIILSLMTVVMVATSTSSVPVQAAANPDLKVKAAVAVDADTGQVLYDKNRNQTLPVASMSKLLSVYIVLQAVHTGKLHWDQRVKVSKPVAKLSQNSEYTNVPLTAGKTYTVRALYQAALIYSANGAIEALAAAEAGSSRQFVSQMKTSAKQLGFKDAKIYNACGLTSGQVKGLGYQKTANAAENAWSATDTARLSMALLKRYPEILKTASVKQMWFAKGTSDQTEMTNWNWMLPGGSAADANLPVDGLKTGTSDAAGANFAGTVKKSGHRLVTVVMGAAHQSASDPARFTQTRLLLNHVYQTMRPVTLKRGTALNTVPTHDGKQKTVKAGLSQPTTVWLTADQSWADIKGTVDLAPSVKRAGALEAPVKQGHVIGTAHLTIAGQPITTVRPSTLQAMTLQPVEKANWFVRTWRNLVNLF